MPPRNAQRVFGAHVPSADPLGAAAEREATAVQIFLSNPQSWAKPLERPDAAVLRTAAIPVFVHSPYLVNLVADNPKVRIPSRKILQETCDAAAAIGAAGVVVHGGQMTGGGGMDEAVIRWRKALESLDTEVKVLIENTAGGDNSVVRTVEGIERLWAGIGDLGPGFVLDTCHAWAGGQPLDEVAEQVIEITGRIDLVHFNDSRDPFDSRRDRHANLGTGLIPETQLRTILASVDAPMVVETPGDVEEHRADLTWMRREMG